MTRITGTARSLLHQLSGQSDAAAHRARGAAHDLLSQAERGKAQAVAAVRELANAIHRTASDLETEGNEQIVSAMRQGASRLSAVGDSLHGRDVSQLVDDTGRWVREHPLAVVAGGVVLGFAVSELLSRYRR